MSGLPKVSWAFSSYKNRDSQWALLCHGRGNCETLICGDFGNQSSLLDRNTNPKSRENCGTLQEVMPKAKEARHGKGFCSMLALRNIEQSSVR